MSASAQTSKHSRSHVPQAVYTPWHLTKGLNLTLFAGVVAAASQFAPEHAQSVAAAALVLAGVVQFIDILPPRHGDARSWLLISALIYVAGGIALGVFSGQVAAAVSLFALFAFLTEGGARAAASIRLRATAASGPLFIGAIATMGLALNAVFWAAPIVSAEGLALLVAAFLGLHGATQMAAWRFARQA